MHLKHYDLFKESYSYNRYFQITAVDESFQEYIYYSIYIYISHNERGPYFWWTEKG